MHVCVCALLHVCAGEHVRGVCVHVIAMRAVPARGCRRLQSQSAARRIGVPRGVRGSRLPACWGLIWHQSLSTAWHWRAKRGCTLMVPRMLLTVNQVPSTSPQHACSYFYVLHVPMCIAALCDDLSSLIPDPLSNLDPRQIRPHWIHAKPHPP